MSRRKALQSRGFTLVELQIAIVIMAMISLLLLGALRLTSQTWRKVAARQDAAEHQFLLSQLLRRHLSGARFFKIRLSSGETVDSLIGGRDYLHYVAPFPRFINDGELYWWTLKIAWDENHQQEVLVLDYQPFDTELAVSLGINSSIEIEGQLKQRLVLDKKIDNLTLAYYGDANGAEDDWHEEWPDDDLFDSAVPQLLSLKMEHADAEIYQPWPKIVLALNDASVVSGPDTAGIKEDQF